MTVVPVELSRLNDKTVDESVHKPVGLGLDSHF